MAKRKSASSHGAPARRHRRTSSSSPLLLLPLEVRRMIWKAVVDAPILLFATKCSQGAPVQVVAFRSRSLDSGYGEFPCSKLHQSRAHETDKGPGPLSWLRTNRQIHAEAQPVVYENLSLHFCDPMILEAVISDRLPKRNLKPEKIRSLSFCLRVQLAHETFEGYRLATNVCHGGHTWTRILRGRLGVCLCPWCFASGCLPNDGPSIDERLPSLREVRFRTYFVCRERRFSYQPPVDQWQNGTLRNGRSYRPTNPSPLVWTGDEEDLRRLVDGLCDERPLGMFQGGRPKSVVVDFVTQGIQHNPVNESPHPHDRCWCQLSVDLESIPKTQFVGAITAQMSAEPE